MREICICWHGRVVIICFLVIRASQNNTYSVCSIKRVGGRNLCILRECTLLTLYFHFKLCMLFSPLSITFIILIFFKLKGQKSREPERKARCGHWPVPRGWRMDGQGNKDLLKTCWGESKGVSHPLGVPVAADRVVMNWNQGSAWIFSRKQEDLGWEEKG